MKLRIEKKNSVDLGFVLWCLNSAISTKEFNEWVYWVIQHSDNTLPTFFFDFIDLDNKVGAIYDAIGFVPSDDLSEEEKHAIEGIGYLRNNDFQSDMASRSEALIALRRKPNIIDRFKSLFPFINLEEIEELAGQNVRNNR